MFSNIFETVFFETGVFKKDVLRTDSFRKLLLLIYLLMSVTLICLGTQCIVINESPADLKTLSTLWYGFLNAFSSHLILITGALTFTHGIWILTRGEK